MLIFKRRAHHGITAQAITFFCDALRGLRFLHTQGWIHRDIKPQNIGILMHPARAVLLDLGQLTKLEHGAKLPASPGCGGTVGYLSPEREMEEHDHGVDIWPMGVIGYELTYGRHPFKLAINPWRPGSQYERLRPLWQDKYEKAITLLATDSKQWDERQRMGEGQGEVHSK